MVEEMAETLTEESETEEQVLSESNVVASVSFGRFESDMLCWERWSSFSQNKYLEEVEKCSTPGSVAEKKAYFEAHYKKIAARKAEIIDQEQQLEVDSLTFEYPNDRIPTRNGCGTRIEFNDTEIDVVSRTDIDKPDQDGVGVDPQSSLVQEIKEEIEVVALVKEEIPLTPQSQELPLLAKQVPLTPQSQELPLLAKEEIPLTPQSQELPLLVEEEMSSQTQVEEVHALIQEENHSTEAEMLSEKIPDLVKQESSSTELEAQCEEVTLLVKEESNSTRSKNKLKQQSRTNIAQGRSKGKDTTLKLGRKEAQKGAPSPKEKNLARTKAAQTKPDPKPIGRPTQASFSRTSKPSSASPAITTAKTSTRKESTPSILRNANVSKVESKRSTSHSQQMSLSMASSKSDSTSVNTARRSFIMENMADKEIVKRAFKAFQNTYDPLTSSSTEVDSPIQQIPKKATNQTSSTNLQKHKQGPVKASGATQSTAKAAPSSLSLRNDERAEKRKDVLKKLDEKSKAKEAERTHLPSKSKERKDVETKRLQGNSNSKTTTMPDRVSKVHVNKDNASNATPHRREPFR